MDLSYTYEKLQAGVESLLESYSNPKDSLFNAWLSQLMRLEVNDFPQNLKLKWATIMEEMTALKSNSPKNNKLKRSIEEKTDEDCQKIINEIIEIWKIIKSMR